MKCPVCKKELEKKKIDNVETDECAQCKGLWFEDDELRQAKDISGQDINWIDFDIWSHENEFKIDARGLKCPACSKSLVTLNYADTGVEIDCCPKCKGVWLDEGEFDNVIKALTEEMYSKSFSDYIKEALQEAKEIITGPESFISEWKDFKAVLGLLQLRLFVENPKLTDAVTEVQNNSPV